MTRMIDLMPNAARARSLRRVNRRRWIAAYAGVALAVFALTGATRVRTISYERELASVQREAQREAEQNRAIIEIGTELRLIGDRIERQARLAPGPGARDTLRVIAASTPPSVTLVSLSYDQRRTVNAADLRALRREGADRTPQGARVDIAGVAVNDTDVARFITNLERSGVFHSGSLEYSRPITVRGAEVREFRISVQVAVDAPQRLASAEVAP